MSTKHQINNKQTYKDLTATKRPQQTQLTSPSPQPLINSSSQGEGAF